MGKEERNAHLLRCFCTLALLFELRINGLLLLLHQSCLQQRSKLPPPSRHGKLEDFIDSKFFVCLYFKLTSFLQGLLLDERNLGPRVDVMTLAKKDGEIDHFVHLAEHFVII
jgi:hypothetical protein